MKPLHLLFAAALFAESSRPVLRAQMPLPPFELALTVNDGTSDTAYLGWPLLLRGDAVLMRNVAAPFPLDVASLTLTIAPLSGTAAPWPLRRVTQFTSAPALGGANESVRIVWLLTAEQSASLRPGDYTATFSWGGKSSPAVTLSVAAPPPALSGDDEIRRAILQSQTALYLGDAAAALAVLTSAEARHPESMELLVQRARAHVQRGEYQDALVAAHRARVIFDRTFPNAERPPASILQIQTQARAELFKARPAGARTPASPAGTVPPAPTGPLPSYDQVMGTAPLRTVDQVRTPTAPNLTPTPVPSQPAKATPPAPITTQALSASAPVAPTSVAASVGATSSIGTVIPSAELSDARILADTAGQWAAAATARTQYDREQYSAARATGAPNVAVAGNSPDAWCPSTRDQGIDWLELTFAKPVQAVEVRVRQNDAPGAITKIEAIEPSGTAHVWWEGVDPYRPSAVREIVWFAVRVPKTSYLVARVKVTLNLASGPGYKQVDAVQLVGAP